MKIDYADGIVGIRRYRPEDVSSLFAAARESVRELSIWMPWCSEKYSLADSETYVSAQGVEWEKGEEYSFVIYDLRNGAFLGGVGLNSVNREHGFANLGYWVQTSRTRQGIASTAARLTARFGIEELKFARLEIVAAVGNEASQRVAEKAGAKREGILRNRLKLHEKLHDAVMYSLTPEDLNA